MILDVFGNGWIAPWIQISHCFSRSGTVLEPLAKVEADLVSLDLSLSLSPAPSSSRNFKKPKHIM